MQEEEIFLGGPIERGFGAESPRHLPWVRSTRGAKCDPVAEDPSAERSAESAYSGRTSTGLVGGESVNATPRLSLSPLHPVSDGADGSVGTETMADDGRMRWDDTDRWEERCPPQIRSGDNPTSVPKGNRRRHGQGRRVVDVRQAGPGGGV